MHVYSCIAWQQTSYIFVLLLGVDRIENTVPLLLLPLSVFTELLSGNALMKSVTVYTQLHGVIELVCVAVMLQTPIWEMLGLNLG
jgi:hypothetical protein